MSKQSEGVEGGWMVAKRLGGLYIMATRTRFLKREQAEKFAADLDDEHWPVILKVRRLVNSAALGYGGAINVALDLPDGSFRVATVVRGGDCYPPLPDLLKMRS